MSFLIFLTSFAFANPTLRPFCSDGCSSAIPSGTKEEPKLWMHCCIEHDLEYWAGGTKLERLLADRHLYECVEKTGHQSIAQIMFKGVRAGGYFFWGNGWGKSRFDGNGYHELTKVEQQIISEKAPADLSEVIMCKAR